MKSEDLNLFETDRRLFWEPPHDKKRAENSLDCVASQKGRAIF